MNEFRYEIGGKTYIQKPLVLGQVRQLGEILQEIIIPGDINAGAIINILGDALPEALSIVLIEEGTTNIKDRDIAALAAGLEWTVSLETTLEVVTDFFDCNPVASILEKLRGKMEEMVILIISRMKARTGLKRSASSSPEETLPNGTPSSGDTPQKSASPGSDIAPEM